MRKYLLLLILSINFICAFSEGATSEPAGGQDKTLTRAEVIEKLSTADFFKKKIGDLLNWSVGYDITKINRTNLAPTISYLRVAPQKVPPDDRTIVTLMAKVSDPSGLDNIKGVRADLSTIDRLPNMMLVDTGLWGDSRAGDGIFTLQTSIGYNVPSGTKDIPVAVANKSGWVAINRTSIDVQLNPVISEVSAVPPSIRADGKKEVLLTARVENPGRQEDLREVAVDLTRIGLDNSVRMWDDGTEGDVKSDDTVFSVSVIPKQGTSSGTKKLTVRASNVFGGSSESEITLVVE
ncbi:MAG: hypothetical protein ABH860_04840 [bacterium]